MGTRHITQVINKKGEVKVSQYGQWDGYIEGQGFDFIVMLNFLGEKFLNKLEKNIEKTKVLNNNDLTKYYKKVIENYNENSLFISMDDAEKFRKIYPTLSRDTGIKTLYYIAKKQNQPLMLMEFNSTKEKNEIFGIEYLHIIDFRDRTYKIKYLYENKIVFKTSLDKPISIEKFVNKYDVGNWVFSKNKTLYSDKEIFKRLIKV